MKGARILISKKLYDRQINIIYIYIYNIIIIIILLYIYVNNIIYTFTYINIIYNFEKNWI